MAAANMNQYHTYDNARLLNLLSGNDEPAFTELYNRFWKKLFVIAFNRLKVTEEAEDIVHDVFVSLWANRKKIAVHSLENYLATATKYMVLGKIKIKARNRILQETPHQAIVAELPIESSIHYKRLLEIVNAEIEKLPEKCRLIFRQSRDEGMAVKEIASQLNISPKTVENQITKAIKQLRKATKALILLFFHV